MSFCPRKYYFLWNSMVEFGTIPCHLPLTTLSFFPTERITNFVVTEFLWYIWCYFLEQLLVLTTRKSHVTCLKCTKICIFHLFLSHIVTKFIENECWTFLFMADECLLSMPIGMISILISRTKNKYLELFRTYRCVANKP